MAKNFIDSIWQGIRYYTWGRPAGVRRFIAQDKAVVRYSSDYAAKMGRFIPAPKIYRPDAFHQLWQDHANKTARGVGSDYTSPPATAAEKPEATLDPVPTTES